MNLERLSEPFPIDRIHWRVGSTDEGKKSGMGLAYIDARDAEDRLNAVCGDNWQCEYPWSDGKKLVCRIGIKIDGEWIWRSNGAGDTDFEADKGAFSDSFKRAAVKWGVARYLYDCPNWWEPIVQRGRSYVFTEPGLKSLKTKMVNWLLPTYQEKFNLYYAKNKVCMDSLVDAILAENIDAAAEYWLQIPEEHRGYLWLAKSSGGIFDQSMKKVIQSTAFAATCMKVKSEAA